MDDDGTTGTTLVAGLLGMGTGTRVEIVGGAEGKVAVGLTGVSVGVAVGLTIGVRIGVLIGGRTGVAVAEEMMSDLTLSS